MIAALRRFSWPKNKKNCRFFLNWGDTLINRDDSLFLGIIPIKNSINKELSGNIDFWGDMHNNKSRVGGKKM